MNEREARTILAECIVHYDPPEPGAENGAAKFLRSDEPLNEFYTGVVAAMFKVFHSPRPN